MSAPRRVILCILIGLCFGVLTSNASYFSTQLRNEQHDIMPSGKIVGADFVCFYFAGWAYRIHPELVYDHAKMREAQQRYFTNWVDPGLLPFAYPPLVATFFSVFTYYKLPYIDAAYLWLMMSIAMALGSFLLILRSSAMRGLPAILGFFAAASYVPLAVYCLAGGQTSCFGLLILALFYSAKQHKREFAAGAVLAASYYKPPLFLALLLFEVLDRNWKSIAGFVTGAAAICTTSVLAAGWQMHKAFFKALSEYGHGHEMLPGFVHRPEMGSGLLSFLLQLAPESPITAKLIFAGMSIGIILIVAFSEAQNDEVKFSLRVCCSLFTSFWLMHYEYALLCVPLLILCARTASAKNSPRAWFIRIALLGTYFSFLLPRVRIEGAELKPELFFLAVLIVSLLLGARRGNQRYFSEAI